MSEVKPDFPLYGVCLSGTRPRTNNRWSHIGGGSRQNNKSREADRKSWRDVMKVAKETENTESSRGENYSSTSGHNQVASPPTNERV